MELKQLELGLAYSLAVRLNRTIMELKLFVACYAKLILHCLNRTIMELKQLKVLKF